MGVWKLEWNVITCARNAHGCSQAQKSKSILILDLPFNIIQT